MMVKGLRYLVAVLTLLVAGVSPVVSPQKAAALSTDRIVYSAQDATGDIVVGVNVDGTNYVKYGNGNGIQLSPDGSKVAFSATIPNATLHPCGLMVGNADGSNLAYTGIELTCPGQNAAGPSFAWSPDSTQLVYSAVNTPNGMPWSLHIANADGSSARELIPRDPNNYNDSPVWSPDGKKILYTRRSTVVNGDNCLSVVYVDSGVTACIDNFTSAITPAWSPDSRKIAYDKNYNSNYHALTVANADGSNKTDIKTVVDGYLFPRWSPDGSKIAYSEQTDFSGNDYISTINPDGTGNLRLLRSPGTGQTSWSPDSSTLLFSAYDSTVSQKNVYAIAATGGLPWVLFNDPSASLTGINQDVRWGGWPQPVSPSEGTLPLITYSLSQRPGQYQGWYVQPVTVTFNCTDDVSVASCTAPVALGDGAGQTVTGTAVDSAGKVTTVTTPVLNIDSTVPVASNVKMSSTTVSKTKPVTITANASDNVSGILAGEYYIDADPGQGRGSVMAYNAATGQVSVSATINSTRGTHTMYVRVQDKAGNWSATTSMTFTFK